MPMNRSLPCRPASRFSRSRRAAFAALPATAAALFTAPPAQAVDDPIPYHFGITQTETADTNVFRLPNDVPRPRDLISTTALYAGIDQPLGRGRFVANLKVNSNNFKNNKSLNYNGGEGDVRLDWESVQRLSGDVGAYQRRTLYRSDPSNASVVTQRDVLRSTGANARVRLGLVSLLALDAGVSFDESRHSSTALANQDLDQTASNIGLRVRPNDLWSARVGWRETRAQYPRFVTAAVAGTDIENEVRRHDLDLSGTWTPNSVSRLDARLSRTQQDQSFAGATDTRFWTGLLGYNWQPTGKTTVGIQYTRDSNVGASDAELRLTPQTSISQSRSDTTLRNAVQVDGKWAATSKINVDTSYSYGRRKLRSLVNTGTLVASDTSRDALSVFSLGATYQVLHSLQVGCRWVNERRDTNATVNTYAYKVDTGMCHLQFGI